MNVRDHLIATLEPLGIDVRYQGSISEDEPISETLITYQIIDSDDHAFYDNHPQRMTTHIQLMIYSSKMAIIKSLPDEISHLIKQAGFIRESRGHDQGFYADHYAWTMAISFTERNHSYV